ncbi:MAG: Fe-S cluster assembly protein SufD [Planctomycetota bacterium]|jgi:Fe-S cluster assembly protein SufD
MTTMMQDSATRLADLPTLGAALVETGPEWLRPIRRDALDRFAALGVPGPRDEEWRFTSLKPVRETAFRLAAPSPAPSEADLEPFGFPGLAGPRLVFVNGRYCPELSTIEGLPGGVTVEPLSTALNGRRAMLEERLAAPAAGEDAFSALNTALAEDGVLVHVARGVAAKDPIHVVSVTTDVGAPVVVSPRNVLLAEAESHVVLIEDYVALTEGSYLTNALTQIEVGANADVHHYFIERESRQAFNVSTLKIHQQRDSRFSSHSVLLGGRVVRNNVNPVLDGEGCDSLLNGLFVGSGKQQLDNHMRVEHAKPHCNSRQFYRGILADRSHGVFSGRIVVVEDAQKTDAVQSNDNLLLSDTAQINTKPQLEIYADDVKCTHGATVGQLDEDAMFYLRCRGLPEPAARAALVYAFASESLQRMHVDPVRSWLSRALLDTLPQSQALHRVFD